MTISTQSMSNVVADLKYSQDTDSPFYECLAYQNMLAKWQLPRDLMGGTESMRDKSRLYLPRHPAETMENYEYRIERAVLRNYFKRSIKTLTGKVFNKPIAISEDVPEKIKQYLQNVDLMGRRLNVFAQDVFEDALVCGISYILVDLPVVDKKLSLYEENKLGLRPYLIHIRPEQIIGWQVKNINNQQILTQVRIKECIVEPEGNFGERFVEQVRVITRDSWSLWRLDNKNKPIEVASGTHSLNKIPLEPVYTNRQGFMKAESPLDDLAWLNLEHYQIRSDQRNALSVASFPLLAIYGVQNSDGESSIAIGPNKIFELPDPQSNVEYVESTGAHLEAGRLELHDLEDQMRLFGLQFEIQKAGYETATGKGIDATQEVSPLKLFATNLQEALENSIKYLDLYSNGTGDNLGTITVNTDFEVSLKDARELQAIKDARTAGDLSRRTYLNEYKRRGILPDEFSVDNEIALLDTETPNDFHQ